MRPDYRLLRTRFILLGSILFTLLFSTTLVSLLSSTWITPARAQSAPEAIHGTTIVVDTSADLDTSATKTCSFTQFTFVAAGDGCTLRRAMVEASARPQTQRPVTITFNLPPGDAVDGVWTLPLDDALVLYTSNDTNGLNNNGSVTLDGGTQPGGRTGGPKIMIDTNDNSLEVESENNIITNLAFKGGGVIFLKADGNIVDQIWMGLTDDGQEISFREPGNEFRMAGGGIHISSDNNIVEDSTISGAFAKAVDIDGGDNNLIQNNQIGTRADGTVPDVPPTLLCKPDVDPSNWYGGWGIALSGNNNQILNNRIAGLNNVRSGNDTPPIALQIFGADHLISGNIIGVDDSGKAVGVCGQGIQVSATGTEILDNQIVRSSPGFDEAVATAIIGTGAPTTFNRVTVRRNIVMDGPGNVYAFGGTGVPDALKSFNPAKVTSINGVTIEGTSGDNSPCPGCVIDFYADDLDTIGEALTHLGSTTADGDGNWSITLGSALNADTGIRTSSTVPSSGIITGFGDGTTTKVSKLFYAIQDISISGPVSGVVGAAYEYTITVTPDAATLPIDFRVQASDKPLQTLNDSQSHAVIASYVWDTPGTKTISVTAENDLGMLMRTLNVEIITPTLPTTPTVPISSVEIEGPASGEVGESYKFTITISPANASGPFDFTVNATEQSQQTLLGSESSAIVATYTWDEPGVKTIHVVVETDAGSVDTTFDMTIAAPSQSESDLYMPKLDK